jgi:hypothetical protein
MGLLLKESLIGLVCCLAGLLLVRLLSFPDTQIDIGVGNVEKDGRLVRGILLDFETPTVDQMHGHATPDDFDSWVKSYVAARLPGTEQLHIDRVPSLSLAAPDTLFHYDVPWSGVVRMRAHMIPPQWGIILRTWGVAFLPYVGVLLLRAIGWQLRRRVVRSTDHR